MSEKTDRPKFREHLHEMGRALAGVGKDVEIGAANAPHFAKVGTRNALARAAGIRKTPLQEWSEDEIVSEDYHE